MRSSPRRTLAALLLVVWALAGCTRTMQVDEPRPRKDIVGVILRTGERIDFPEASVGRLEAGAVVVRRLDDYAVVASYPAHDIERAIERYHISPGEAAVGVAVVVILGALVYAVIELVTWFHDMSETSVWGGAQY